MGTDYERRTNPWSTRSLPCCSFCSDPRRPAWPPNSRLDRPRRSRGTRSSAPRRRRTRDWISIRSRRDASRSTKAQALVSDRSSSTGRWRHSTTTARSGRGTAPGRGSPRSSSREPSSGWTPTATSPTRATVATGSSGSRRRPSRRDPTRRQSPGPALAGSGGRSATSSRGHSSITNSRATRADRFTVRPFLLQIFHHLLPPHPKVSTCQVDTFS